MKYAGFRAAALVLSLGVCPGFAFAQNSPESPIPSAAQALERPALPMNAVGSIRVPAFGELFKASALDFKALSSRSNVAVLGVGLAASGAFMRSDLTVSSKMASSRWADGAFSGSAVAGQFPLHLAAGLAAYSIGRSTGAPRLALFGGDLVRAQLLAQGTTQAIKHAVGRTRPDGSNSHSFPSGHTSTMFATATVVQRHFGWKAGIPAYAAAAYVAAGRVQDQRHYLSDVAFGAALGIVAGRTVTVGTGKAKFAVAPMAAQGGAGVSFTLLDR
jgi:membrane-associated phospholipid phosphatase